MATSGIHLLTRCLGLLTPSRLAVALTGRGQFGHFDALTLSSQSVNDGGQMCECVAHVGSSLLSTLTI